MIKRALLPLTAALALLLSPPAQAQLSFSLAQDRLSSLPGQTQNGPL